MGLFVLKREIPKAFAKLEQRVEHPLTLKEAMIIGIIIWIFWPNHHAIGVSNPPTLKLPTKAVNLPQTALKAVPEASYAPQPVAYATPSPGIGGCGDNVYKQFIYQHESGCDVNAVNYLGCRGIGQACPGSKLPCGADFACQDAYFTEYANERYGGWEQAYNAWVAQGWW